MNATNLDYRKAFLRMLNNREKDRNQGFVVFVHGSEDLAPMEEVCFASEQTYNTCLTVRYGAGQGNVLTPLIRKFVQDAQTHFAGGNTNIQAQSTQSSIGTQLVTGQFRPPPPEGDWPSFFDYLRYLDPTKIEINAFFSVVQSGLRVGQRLVFFCELADLAEDRKLEDIGFDDTLMNQLKEQLPERMGLVFSGLPAGLELSGLENRFLKIKAGPDYTTGGIRPALLQPLKNDSPLGEDRLSIISEVNALTDAIASKDMDPPLVVGILGGWGAGKSFVLHLLQERLRSIRNQDLSNKTVLESNPYVGHPYLVRFDAWTYAKADLWASLMERILFDLDQQLNLEQVVAPLHILEKGFDLWEIIAHSSPGQLQALKSELGEEAIKLISDWRQGGATASALWGALKTLRADELGKLEKAKDDLELKKKNSAEALHKTQIEAEQKLLQQKQKFDKEMAEEQQLQKDGLAKKEAELESAKARVTAEVDAELESEARKDAWIPVFGEFRKFFGGLANQALQQSGAKSGEAPISIWMIEKEFKLFTKYWAGLLQSPTSIAFLVFAILTLFASWYWAQVQFASRLSALGAFGGMLASLYTAVTKVNRWFEAEQSRYDAQIERFRGENGNARENKEKAKREAVIGPIERDIQKLQTMSAVKLKGFEENTQQQLKNQQMDSERQLTEQKKAAQIEIQNLEDQVVEHERRAGIPGQSKSLVDLIQKRIASGYYQERLGIVHQVQNDLLEITEALIPATGYNPKLFPRGAPRVIILIDDLDRCPPDKVVQVLEVAQLLVKTRLFVVVLAMDVRYVTRALEKEYAGILVHEGNPSGLDYAEKIVQIPYRVRPIAPVAMPGYLSSQMMIHKAAVVNIEPVIPPLPAGGAFATITPPGHANMRVNVNLSPEIQEFEQSELDMMAKAAGVVEISPRATKRLVNVMKLIKNIWYRREMGVPSAEVMQAMVLLLTLSASYPEVLARILNELEHAFRDEEKFDPQRNLRTAMQDIISHWSVREGITGDWMEVMRLIQVDNLLASSLTLGTLGLDNLQIVRSFSFLGEVDMPLVEKMQKHAIEILPAGNGMDVALPIKPRATRTMKKAVKAGGHQDAK